MGNIKEYEMHFRFKDIKVVNFSIEFSNLEIGESNENIFVFENSIALTVFGDLNEIHILFHFEVFKDESKKIKVGNFRTVFIYDVKNLDKLILSNNQINLPDTFLVTLFSLSISTARGIWYEKTRGTLLEKAILPILNPKELFNNLKQIEAKKVIDLAKKKDAIKKTDVEKKRVVKKKKGGVIKNKTKTF